MFNRFKSALYNAVGVEGNELNEGSASAGANGTRENNLQGNVASAKQNKNRSKRLQYCRPSFLQLNTPDEVSVTADHAVRPIICPRSFLPWNSGYAETVNAGKSRHNEDQSTVSLSYLTRVVEKIEKTSTSGVANDATSSKTDAVNGDSKLDTTSEDAKEKTVSPEVSNEETLNSNSVETNSITEEPKLTNGSVDVDAKDGLVSKDESAQPPGSPHYCNPKSQDKLFVDEGYGLINVSLPYYYFAVFDGHAGWGAAVYASKHLHDIIHGCLSKVVSYILPDPDKASPRTRATRNNFYLAPPTADPSSVIIGALEHAFHLMDKKIEQDRHKSSISGGCTACVAVFIGGKLYVANAGDSRATASIDGSQVPMSNDFTPETENYRVRKLGFSHPELLAGSFNPTEFLQRPLRNDVGKEALCRQPHMAKGWAHKRITEDDLKYPLVCGSGKRSRVMGTIGVTRGFGDHDLKAQISNTPIKPFLSSEPEVIVFDLTSSELSDNDALILGTDGLWDIVTNEKAVGTLKKSLVRSQHHLPVSDPNRHKYRYTSAAQDLVMSARGKLTEHNWRTNENKPATIDDIAVFVIPLKPYKMEHMQWSKMYDSALKGSLQLTKSKTYKQLLAKDNELKSELPITSTITEAISSKNLSEETNQQDVNSQTFGLSMSNFFPSPGSTLSAILSSSSSKEISSGGSDVKESDASPAGDEAMLPSTDDAKSDGETISLSPDENITGHIELMTDDKEAASAALLEPKEQSSEEDSSKVDPSLVENHFEDAVVNDVVPR